MPNTLISYLLIPVLGVIIWLPDATHADEAGIALATRVYNRPDGDDSVSRAYMILSEKGHKPRHRKLYTYQIDKEQWRELGTDALYRTG